MIMRRTATAAFALLLAVVGAAPYADHQLLERAPSCNADNCYRAVVASRIADGPARGSADCSSFLAATVSPCPSTSTSTVTSTETASTQTVVNTATTTTTSIDVSTSVSTSLATSTSVTTISDIPLTTSVSTTTVTSTSVVLATVTVTTPAAADPARRQVREADQALGGRAERFPVQNLRREAAATCTTALTMQPSSVPAYASACSGTARYSSVCSCVASRSTSSLTASTVTVTSTVMTTVRPTTTLSTTSVALTSSLSVTGSIALATVTVTSTTTLTSTSTIAQQSATTTVTTTTPPAATQTVQPRSGNFLLRWNTGGYLIAEYADQPLKESINSQTFYLDEQARFVFPFGAGYMLSTIGDPTAAAGNFLSFSQNGLVNRQPRCAFANPAAASGRFTCVVGSGLNVFYRCAENKLSIGAAVPDGCSEIRLTAIPF